ncbi:hypothetical protein WJX81_007362 [Elliptochloris bilobata]|uniref:Prolyl endopeptidase n=1 Tax=Elliptochloris bilobata TaxID=381761 RepID=A0AAW1SLY4_9CHLO
MKAWALLFEPPPFNPAKLTTAWLPGVTRWGPMPPASRRYTLTHNDLTGELQLSVGAGYNTAQISSWYNRLIRDEVLAEWRFSSGGRASLHVHCHVSGEERWLAPPSLRDFIFRREMPLVLDTLCYADRTLLAGNALLADAIVFVHLSSHIKGLDATLEWGWELSISPSDYPQVRRDESVVEMLHGTRIADPYRWLEDPDSDETRAFVDAQNSLTERVFKECDTRERFEKLMTELYDYPHYGAPFRRGSRYYFFLNTGLQQHSVLYTQASLDAEPQVLLDPNTLSSDGTVALTGQAFSHSGELMAYSLGSGGSDWRTIKLMRIDQASGKGEDLSDTLEHVKFSSMAWTHDDKGFFYNRYEQPAEAKGGLGTETGANKDQQLWYHVVGTPQAKDKFVYALPEAPDWMIGAQVSDDGSYLLMSLSAGCEPANRLYFLELESLPRSAATGALDLALYDRAATAGVRPLPLVKLVDTLEAQYSYVANEGSVFTFHTNLHAPRYRVIRTDVSRREKATVWEEIVPEHPTDLLQWGVALKGGVLVAGYLHDVAAVLQLRRLSDGALERELKLPGLGSVREFSGRSEHSEAFFTYTDYVTPGSFYRFDAAQPDEPPQLFRETELRSAAYRASDFETRQVFVTSRDGTRVPMFIVARKGIKLDGSNPTLLYGYGGFNISLEPGFSVSRLCWMLAYGGVYAVANLRGGGEYGTAWREAGSCAHKQNAFDDFVACAEHLQAAGYTCPGKLVIQGGSNGGLLVAACTNQRPDLFGAVLAQVGVMDLLRFHKFTIGHAWVTDYGSPDDAAAFKTLLAISPVHNVRVPRGGTRQYPAMLLTTGDHDDRVVPLHSHKLTATLQHVLAGGPDAPQRNPLLTRVEVRAGHGAGKPTAKIIAECADMYAFAAKALGAPWKAPEL